MCRFYSITVYYTMLKLGYRKMMRLDDDGYILSKIPNVFEYVSPENPYLCRLFQNESTKTTENILDHVDEFAKFYNIRHYRRPKETEIVIPFNNFFVLDLSFYQDMTVSQFLKYVDLVGGIYENLWGDALVQGLLLKLKNVQVQKFEFAYGKWGRKYVHKTTNPSPYTPFDSFKKYKYTYLVEDKVFSFYDKTKNVVKINPEKTIYENLFEHFDFNYDFIVYSKKFVPDEIVAKHVNLNKWYKHDDFQIVPINSYFETITLNHIHSYFYFGNNLRYKPMSKSEFMETFPREVSSVDLENRGTMFIISKNSELYFYRQAINLGIYLDGIYNGCHFTPYVLMFYWYHILHVFLLSKGIDTYYVELSTADSLSMEYSYNNYPTPTENPMTLFCKTKNDLKNTFFIDPIFISTFGFYKVLRKIERTRVPYSEKMDYVLFCGKNSHGFQRTNLEKLLNREYLGIKYFSKEFTEFEEKLRYRYIMEIDGWATSFFYLEKLYSGSLVLKQESEFEMIYDRKVIPFQHYVPFKADFSDLKEKIEWCRQNPIRCEQITKNAIELVKNELTFSKVNEMVQESVWQHFQFKRKKPSRMKLCICFFGVISRSIEKTIDSIRQNIFDEIRRHHHEFDVYVHNNKVDKLVADGDKDIKDVLPDKCHLLPSDYFSETIQDEFDQSFPWNEYCKYGYHDNFSRNTFKNALRQLYSVKKVTEMWKNSNIHYDYFIYVRPDIEYTNKINIKEIEEYCNKNILLTPNWGKHGGLNDRIYMGPENIISHFGCRLDYVLEIINRDKIPYHPETFMRLVAEKFSIPTKDIDFRANRVRAHGGVSKDAN